MNIEYVQNRFDKCGVYLNSYIKYGNNETTIVNLYEDDDLFTKATYTTLRSYILPNEKNKLFHRSSSPIKSNYITISNSHIRSINEIKKSTAKKSFKRPVVKCEYDNSIFISDISANCPSYNDSIRRNSMNSIYSYYKNKVNYKIYRTMSINRAAHYVNGIDDSTDVFDENSVYLYVNEKAAYSKINVAIANYNATHKSSHMHKLANTLYDMALAYFIIGRTYNNDEISLDRIMFIISSILCYSFDTASRDNDWINGVTWKSLETKVKKLLEKTCQDGIEFESKRLTAIFGKINKCRFPDSWSRKEQNDWKNEHGITRKARKDIDRDKVREMTLAGYKVKDILSMFNISKRTYYKIINSNTDNTININNSFNYTNKYTFFENDD